MGNGYIGYLTCSAKYCPPQHLRLFAFINGRRELHYNEMAHRRVKGLNSPGQLDGRTFSSPSQQYPAPAARASVEHCTPGGMQPQQMAMVEQQQQQQRLPDVQLRPLMPWDQTWNTLSPLLNQLPYAKRSSGAIQVPLDAKVRVVADFKAVHAVYRRLVPTGLDHPAYPEHELCVVGKDDC